MFIITNMRRQGFRTRRSTRMAPVIQSYKKVINHAPASIAAASNNILEASTGEENAVVGQTSPVDVDVPTGAVIKYIEFQISLNNIVENPAFAHVLIMQKLSGQGNLSPNVVGGNPLRNQVFHQDLFAVAANQNVNRVYKFKVPKKFQRVREGATWQLIMQCNQAVSMAGQFIYKFYR